MLRDEPCTSAEGPGTVQQAFSYYKAWVRPDVLFIA